MMESRRPVNRVTSRRRPAAGSTRATAAKNPAKKTPTRRVAGRATAADARRASIADTPPAASRRPRLPRPRAPRWSSPRRSLVLGIVAVVLLAIFAGIAALRPGVDYNNRAFVDNAETEQVKNAASQILTTVYGTDAKNLAGYKDAAKKVLTGKALADSDKYLDTVAQAVQQTDTKATVRNDPIGVTLLTKDHAELLVNMTVGVTKDGVAQQSMTGPILIRLDRVDGRWLASDLPDR
ncbi:hypothetical protein [Nocardia terpenica]|uniref:hypothetical protein n=1 Tax=Nocardia terpenica TaxID=455432 RepID=UPI001E34190D|nr:hypothetical protein [Nocardia terpenica]